MKRPIDNLMTVADCAREARVSHWTVRRWIAADELPAWKLRTGLRVKRADFGAFLARELEPANALAVGLSHVGASRPVGTAPANRGE